MNDTEKLKMDLIETADGAIKRVRLYLLGKSKEEMKIELQNSDTCSLIFIYNSALFNEDYEICGVTKEILNPRKLMHF